MSEKKKGPGVRGAGTLKNRVRKKQPKNTKRRRRVQRKPWAPRRELWLYDGHKLLATLVVTSAGPTRAFDAERKSLGRFATLKLATIAVNKVQRGGAT
jgi:hypothetical protein